MNRDGKWARAILLEQHEDGTWGEEFHGMAQPRTGVPLTTEQALRRLRALGFTKEDSAIRAALDCMTACLRGERKIDNYWEKGHDWVLYTQLMLACWVRLFDPENETAKAFANRWAKVITCAFTDGAYDARAYAQAYALEFSPRMGGSRERDFVDFYHVNLIAGLLEPEIEVRVADHILDAPMGIYYLNNTHSLRQLPPDFSGLGTLRYLAAVECLAGYACAAEKLAFVTDWLRAHQSADGTWDLGPKARDGIHLPLSDSWRKTQDRRADCTVWINAILKKLEE